MPLLEGLDGIKKMSKSENNYIGITEDADQIFGKTMSIPDEIMFKWFDLLSLQSTDEIKKIKKSVDEGGNPRDAKIILALELTRGLLLKKRQKLRKKIFLKNLQKTSYPAISRKKQ